MLPQSNIVKELFKLPYATIKDIERDCENAKQHLVQR